jgi:hypothetical protein
MAFMHSERCGQAIRFFPMKTADQYLLFAEECERLAKQPSNERLREVLIDMAEEWRKLAQAAQKKT